MLEKNTDKAIAILTTIITVLLAFTGFMGNKANGDSTTYLLESNDQWAMYQAKSIKATICESDRNMMLVQLSNDQNSEQYKAVMSKKVEEYNQKIAQYALEKEEIQNTATNNKELANKFYDIYLVLGYATGMFQVALVLAALTMLFKHRSLWYVNSALLAVAIFVTCRGLYKWFY